MTHDELSELTHHIHINPDKFYTDLSAHNLGYRTETPDIFVKYNFNKTEILDYIARQKPHLLKHYVKFEGKLNRVYDNIIVNCNMSLYSDDIVLNDITVTTFNDYIYKLNILEDTYKHKLYNLINISNIDIIIDNNFVIPIKFIKKDYMLKYINYISTKPNFINFLDELDDSVYILENYTELMCDTVDYYIMSKVTIFTQQTFSSLLMCQVPLSVILKYRPQFLEYSIDYITNIGDLKVCISAINKTTDIRVLNRMFEKFDNYKELILNKINSINI